MIKSIQPPVSTWQDALVPFNLSIVIVDDYGVRLCGKQLYIKYHITTDGSTPDIENYGTKIYSNVDGVLELFFNQFCRVTIDLYYVEKFDPSLNLLDIEADPDKYICERLCDNCFLPFQPYIKSFDATYISDKTIAVTEPIPRKYVQVTLKYSDLSTSTFTIENELYNDYIINPTVINHINENIINVSYYDPLLNKTWTDDITVLGKVKELSIFASYVGNEKQLNNFVSKSEVVVTLTVFDGYSQEVMSLSEDKWAFTVYPQVTNLNEGLLEVEYNGLKAKFQVPVLWEVVKYRLDAWYEGLPVQVGKSIDLNNFRVYLYYENGLHELNDSGYNSFSILLEGRKHCIIDPQDYIIHHTGLNWFTVRYTIKGYTIYDRVAIMGYVEKEYPEDEFKLYYLNPDYKSYEDVTEKFRDSCMIGERLYINWDKLGKRIYDVRQFGKYWMYAPKLTGLSTRLDTEWIIRCFKNEYGFYEDLNAELIKTHNKKEEK